jgi:beta-glucanase (GH16 family)
MKTRSLLFIIIFTFLLTGCGASDSAAPAESTAAPAPATAVPTATATPAPTSIPTSTPIATPEPVPVEAGEGWELVWSDEFDGEAINPANWTYDLGGWGWGNGEAQFYTDRPENARVENGLLVIEGRQEKYEDKYYTSARLISQGLQEFQYGRIEARIKVPPGAGLWPAFWMLGDDFSRNPDNPIESNWPQVGEIDIMEYVGREPDLVIGTAHGPGYAGAGGLTRWNRQDFPIADEFHTYAIEWAEDEITWFFDGEPYYIITPEIVGDREWVFNKEFFLLLNLAIGGQLAGTIALDTQFPANVYVDYVRVYQQTTEAGG